MVWLLNSMEALSNSYPEFGVTLLETDFVLEKGYTFINHGFKGAVPKPVIVAQQIFQDEMRKQPANFFMRKKLSAWTEGRDAVANFLNADPHDMVLVPNVTTGITTILMSIPFVEGETILITSHVFQATNNACARILQFYKGVTIKTIHIDLPIQNEAEVVSLYREALEKDPTIRVVIIDYVSCASALQLPVDEILKVTENHDAITIVDGAHCPGQIPLNLNKMEADYFTGNFHKWMFSPWGNAFIWKNKRTKYPLRPLASSSPEANDIVSQFSMQGTRDDSCYDVLPVAIAYLNSKGGLGRISEYNKSLLELATQHLISLWNTSKLPIPVSMETPFLRMIRLPEIHKYGTSQTDANQLMDIMYMDYHIDVCLKSVNNSLYVRLSAQIYNTLEDYKKFGEAVLSLVGWIWVM